MSLRNDIKNLVGKTVEETLNALLDEEASELVGAEHCPRAAAVLEEAEPDVLAYLDFPPSHWKRLRANNVQALPVRRREIEVCQDIRLGLLDNRRRPWAALPQHI